MKPHNQDRSENTYCAADWPAVHAHSQPIPIEAVAIEGYLGRRIDQNLDSLLAGLASPVVRYFESSVEGRQQVEEEAIRLAADSDLYKWLEGASYVFVRSGDSRLKASIDRMAVLILQCQERDGYINAQKEHKDRFDEKVCHDLYLETGREDLLQHVPGLWDEIVDSRMYVTGAVASHGESFSPEPFNLPHTQLENKDRSLGETCASIAFILYSWRMHAITGESRHFDAIENTLYNHVFGAASLDGMGTFYYNPMRMVGDLNEHTDHWHRPVSSRCMLPKVNRTSCCMTNLWRFLGALPEYVFSFDPNGVSINLYTSASVTHGLPDGRRIDLTIETEYPHQGEVSIRFDGEEPTPYNLRLRIPGWCSAATVDWPEEKKQGIAGGCTFEIDRTWEKGDTVQLALDIPVRMILSDARVVANTGQVVFARGPVLYCLEQEDVQFPVEQAAVALDPADVSERVRVEWCPDLLSGIHTLRLPGLVDGEPTEFTLVPWSVRANRSENSRWVIFLPLAHQAKDI